VFLDASIHLSLFKLVFQAKEITLKIKELADVRALPMETVDALLRVYVDGIDSGELIMGKKETFDRLLRRYRIVPSPNDRARSPSVERG
jgi:homocitrate synthase